MVMTKHKNRRRIRSCKNRKKITNWNKYNPSLKLRGDIIFWMTEDAINVWGYTGKRGHGGHYKYSHKAILTCIIIKTVYHQSLIQNQGLVSSIFRMMGLKLSVPDFTVVSRRSKKLGVEIALLKSELDRKRGKNNAPVHIVVDSTGLKIHGEGEWMSQKHKTKPRKAWRKMHMACETDRSSNIRF